MNKFNSFFQTLKESVYSPKFYSQILDKPFRQAFGYFFLLILFLSIIRVITLIVPLGFTTSKQLQKGIEGLISCYPQDLEIDIKQGQATTSSPIKSEPVKQPYFLSCDKQKSASESAILVVDTQTPYSKGQFDKYQTPGWLTKDALVVKGNYGEIKSYDLSKIKNFSLNKNIINSTYAKYSKYFVFAGPVLLLLSFVILYIGYIFNLIYLSILAIVIFVVFKMTNQKDLNYFDAYKICLYAITPALLVEFILDALSPWTHFNGFPFMFTLIILATIYINLFSQETPVTKK